ncbi:hypothetical protein TNCV_4085381 [Trichonephila clavipes]|nr:hypothetical protein TNCV_4085381 [Trichonephila clavipes]
MASSAKEQKGQDSKCNGEFKIWWTEKHGIINKSDKVVRVLCFGIVKKVIFQFSNYKTLVSFLCQFKGRGNLAGAAEDAPFRRGRCMLRLKRPPFGVVVRRGNVILVIYLTVVQNCEVCQ